jgi:hypothetical protein
MCSSWGKWQRQIHPLTHRPKAGTYFCMSAYFGLISLWSFCFFIISSHTETIFMIPFSASHFSLQFEVLYFKSLFFSLKLYLFNSNLLHSHFFFVNQADIFTYLGASNQHKINRTPTINWKFPFKCKGTQCFNYQPYHHTIPMSLFLF